MAMALTMYQDLDCVPWHMAKLETEQNIKPGEWYASDSQLFLIYSTMPMSPPCYLAIILSLGSTALHINLQPRLTSLSSVVTLLTCYIVTCCIAVSSLIVVPPCPNSNARLKLINTPALIVISIIILTRQRKEIWRRWSVWHFGADPERPLSLGHTAVWCTESKESVVQLPKIQHKDK